MRRIGFTGTRLGLSREQSIKLSEILWDLHNSSEGGIILHHGCDAGADHGAALICQDTGIPTAAHPPANDKRMCYECMFSAKEKRDPKTY